MKTQTLKRLTPQGLLAVNAKFIASTERLEDGAIYAAPIPNLAPVDQSRLELELEGRSLGPKDDPTVARLLHEQLPIRRGVATDPQFWAWLAASRLPHVLRGRWSTPDRAANRNRFVGRIVDHGLARLWWAAELTSREGRVDTKYLSLLLGGQYRTDRILSTPILRQGHVVRALLDVLGDDVRWQVLNGLCARVGVLATTYDLAAMTESECRAFFRRQHRPVSPV